MKTFKLTSKIDKNHWAYEDINWLLFKLNAKPIKDDDMDWIANEIEELDFFIEMLAENDEVEFESATTDYMDISETDKVFIYTSLMSCKKDQETQN